MTWPVLASSVLRRVRSAIACPGFDLSNPERVICGAASITETPETPATLRQYDRQALIERRDRMKPSDPRRGPLNKAIYSETHRILGRK